MVKEHWTKRTKGPVIFTEGDNDCHVIVSICQKYGINESFGFYSCGSDDQCIKALRAKLYSSDIPDKLAIVIDADNPSLDAKWNSIKSILSDYMDDVPDIPDENGCVLELNKNLSKPIRLGVWFMPNNRIDGMLEDFCIELAPEESIQLATEYIDKCIQNELWNCARTHRSKSIIHAFLAVQDEPGNPLGLALTKNNLNINHESVLVFRDWLNRVFN